MKKILQILYPGLGGHSSVGFSLVESSPKQGFEHYLLGFGIEAPSDVFTSKASQMGIDFDYVKKKQGFDIQSQLQVYRYLKKVKPEYIILHSVSLILLVFFYSVWNKTQWVVVEHNSNKVKGWTDWVYTVLILILSSKIVYLTHSYKQEIFGMFKWLSCLKSKVSIIPNGVNPHIFYPLSIQNNQERLTLSMISRLTPLRDHRTLIKAMAEVMKIYPFCQLYIAGDGSTRSALEELVDELELRDVVIFCGTLKESDVVELIHQTDIYVHSSLAETLSTSLLQVMACRVPIIATNIDGINNLLQNEQDALLFEAEQEEDLKNKIVRLLGDIVLRDKIANNAYMKFKKLYDSTALFERYWLALNK